jgi:hypothetical protein
MHVPLEFAAFEPIQHVHRRFIEGQRDLVGKVSVDFEDDRHSAMENTSRTRVNGASYSMVFLSVGTRYAWEPKNDCEGAVWPI